MRTSLLLAAALIGIAAPAFAQDRTLPAGSFDGMRGQPGYGTTYQTLVPSPATTYEGRSVSDVPVASVHHHSHRR